MDTSSKKELAKIFNHSCRECPLGGQNETTCMSGTGNSNAELMVIGEAPGEAEDRLGEPFIGKAGQVLNDLLTEFGIKRENIYISNAVKCRPPNNRSPHVKEIRSCRHYLLDEIRIVQPKVILAVGAVAMRQLLNETTFAIATNRSIIHHAIDSDINDIPIFVTYHPAAILRDERYLDPTIADFQRVKGYLEHGEKPKAETKYYRGVAPAKDHVVVDVETSSLNMYDPSQRILCIGSSVRSTTGYCTTDINSIREILADASITKIAHNYKFDYKWLRTRGYKINGPAYCTMVGAHLLDENAVSFGLKELAAVHTDMAGYAARMDKALRLVKNDMTKVPEKIRDYYCAQDVDATHRLYDLQVPELKKQNLWPLTKLTMRGMQVMANAEYHGVAVDIEQIQYLSKVFRRNIAKLYKEIEERVGIEKFNPDSTLQLGKVLSGKLGFTIHARTKSGRIKVDKFILEKLAEHDKSGFVRSILKLRKLKGDYSKYLDPNKPVYSGDGKVHTDYRINGTDTGRYSCSNPNLQAVTKKSPIKRIFVSSFKGGKLVQFDYDQGELRLLAQYSQDKKLLAIFRSGHDIHKATASEIFRIPIDQVTEEQRFGAKTVNFGIIYGMGADKLARTIKVGITEAAGYIRDYLRRFPGVEDYRQAMSDLIVKEGEVISLFGRRRRILILSDETTPFQDLSKDEQFKIYSAQRRAVNAPIQGGLHDLNMLGVVELNRQFKIRKMRARVILVVHDSIIVDCPEDELQQVIELGQEILCNPDTSAFNFKFNVPLTVSVGYGNSWKEAAEASKQ